MIKIDPPIPLEPPIRFVPSRLAMFLELGRLKNYFGFLVYYSVFSSSRSYLNSALAILAKIEEVVAILNSNRDTSAANAALRSLKSEMLHHFKTEAWAEQCGDAFFNVSPHLNAAEASESGESRVPHPDGRQAVWSSLQLVARSRCEELDRVVALVTRNDDETNAVRLGVHFDAAIRPVPTFDNTLRDLGPEPADPTMRFDAFGSATFPRRYTVVFEPSDPTFSLESWLQTLRSICSTLALSGSCVREGEFLFSSDRQSVVGRLIEEARTELERRSAPLTADQAIPVEGREKLTVEGGTTQSKDSEKDLASPPDKKREAAIAAIEPIDAAPGAQESSIPTDPTDKPPAKAAKLRHYPTKERDAFIYALVMEGKKQYSEIIGELTKKINEGAGWEAIESDNGIKKAAKRYADLNKLPKPPFRKKRTKG